MFPEICSLMATIYAPSMLFNHYFTMITSNNFRVHRSPTKSLLSLFRTILHVQQPVRVIKISTGRKHEHTQCLAICLILLALLPHPFLNILSYLFLRTEVELALEYQPATPGGRKLCVLMCANSSGYQIPAGDFATFPS